MAMMMADRQALANADEGVHVYVHDGLLRRLGELQAFRVNRGFFLGRVGTASFSLLPDDPLIAHLNPDTGATVVIESEVYAKPWVGYVSSLSGNDDTAVVTASCREYSALLEQRYLPDRYETSGALADEFRRVLDTVNTRNQTLIRVGAVEDRAVSVSGLRLSNNSAAQALDLLAGLSVTEWYVDAAVSGGVVEVTANLVVERGVDRTGDVEWTVGAGGNAVLRTWVRLAGALPALAVVVGGDATGGESFDARPRSTVASRSGAGRGLSVGSESRQPPRGVHGYRRFTPKVSAPATRIEHAVLQDQAIDRQSTVTAAEAAVSRPTFAERTATVRVLDAAAWSSVELGDVVRLDLPSTMALGPVAAGRVMAISPYEHINVADVECEVLGEDFG